MNPIPLLAFAALLLAAPTLTAHDPAGTHKNYCEDQSEWSVHEYSLATGVLLDGYEDGNVGGDCDGNSLPADYDGHAEYARGGAWLLACDAGCGALGEGAGSYTCFGDPAHHPSFPPVSVNDVVLGSGASFSVAVDNVDLTGIGGGCGDFEPDEAIDCVGSCVAPFGPGLDGAYYVYVQGTQGHVVS